MTAELPAAAAVPKFTTIEVEGNCPEVLCDLGKQIAVHLGKARKSEEKAEQHRITAAQLLVQAKDLCDAGGFTAFHEKFCPDLGRSRTYELLPIATDKKSIEDTRASTRERVARHRAKKTESVTSPVTDSTAPTSNGNDVDTEESARRMALLHERASGDVGNDRVGEDQADTDTTPATAISVESPPPSSPPSEPASPPSEPAPDPAATAAAAVNQLSCTELDSFLDQLTPAHKAALKLKFGARNSDYADAEIATLVDACSGLLAHPQQNTGEIRKKLARIKKLTGGKARTSNAQFDRGAFTRGMGLAGQPGEKFPTMNMTPNGVDETGNKNFALPRGSIHGARSSRE